jgi:hypothetical protein
MPRTRRMHVHILKDGRLIREANSIRRAAKVLGVYPNAVRVALENGTHVAGHHCRYADMPPECQPLKPPRRHCDVATLPRWARELIGELRQQQPPALPTPATGESA